MMKKLVVFLFLALGAIGIVSAQKKQVREKHYPILPYNENGYSVYDLDTFLFKPTPLHASYRKKFLEIINKGLYQSGEYVNVNGGKPLDEHNIAWIMKHMRSAIRTYKNFTNSYQSYDFTAVEWYQDNEATSFTGDCFYFEFRSCGIPTGKKICMNMIDVGFERLNFQGLPPQHNPDSTGTTTGTPWVYHPPLSSRDTTPNKAAFVPKKPATRILGMAPGVFYPLAAVTAAGATWGIIELTKGDDDKSKGGNTNPNGGEPGGTPINPGHDVIRNLPPQPSLVRQAISYVKGRWAFGSGFGSYTTYDAFGRSKKLVYASATVTLNVGW